MLQEVCCVIGQEIGWAYQLPKVLPRGSRGLSHFSLNLRDNGFEASKYYNRKWPQFKAYVDALLMESMYISYKLTTQMLEDIFISCTQNLNTALLFGTIVSQILQPITYVNGHLIYVSLVCRNFTSSVQYFYLFI